MVEVKKVLRSTTFGSGYGLLTASDLIKTKLITSGTYGWRDKRKLGRMYADYRQETKMRPPWQLTKSFWKDIDKETYMVLMALERKTGKPLGFMRIFEEKSQPEKKLWIMDTYTVPAARRLGVASKLVRKAYTIARMKGITSLAYSSALSEGGKRLAGRVDHRREKWADIPQGRFPEYKGYAAGLRKRKGFK